MLYQKNDVVVDCNCSFIFMLHHVGVNFILNISQSYKTISGPVELTNINLTAHATQCTNLVDVYLLSQEPQSSLRTFLTSLPICVVLGIVPQIVNIFNLACQNTKQYFIFVL